MLNTDSRSTCHWKLFCRRTSCLPPILTANRLRPTMVIHYAAVWGSFLGTKIWRHLIYGKAQSGCVLLNSCHEIGADFGNKLVTITVQMYGGKKGLDNKMGRGKSSTHFCLLGARV